MSEIAPLISVLKNSQINEEAKGNALESIFELLFETEKQIAVGKETIPVLKEILTNGKPSPYLLEKALLVLGAMGNQPDLRASIVRSHEFIPLVTNYLITCSSELRDKVSSCMTSLCFGMVDAVNDAVKAGIIPHLVELIQGPSESDQAAALKIVSNFCAADSTAATKMMFHGAIPVVLQRIQSENKNVASSALTALGRLVCSPTVRGLISEILPLHMQQLKTLTEMCSHQSFNYTLVATQSLAMLLLNQGNHYALRSVGALKAIEHILAKDPGQKLPTHYASAHWIRAHYPLFNSPFWQVRAYAAYFFARFCGKFGESVNVLDKEAGTLIHREALCQIRILALDSKDMVRNLARIALVHFQDEETLEICSVDTWLRSLEISESMITVVVKECAKNEITMDRLFCLELALEDVRATLGHLSVPSGITLKMLSSWARIRKFMVLNHMDSNSLAKISSAMTSPLEESSMVEREESSVSELRRSSTKNSEHPDQPDVFLSYCWGNKPAAQRLKRFLNEQGLKVWMDEQKIKPGEHLFNEIDDGVSNCQVFLACLSPDYSRSVNCKRELLLATERRKLIIPLHVAELEEWPPRGDLGPLLAGKVYINLSSEEKFEQLQEQLVAAIKQSLNG